MTAAEPAGDPFEALADPNRRLNMELLGAGRRGGSGRSVQELADEIPISRPALSRHLRLLKEAGLVTEEPRGTRHIYRLHDAGASSTVAGSGWGLRASRGETGTSGVGPACCRTSCVPPRFAASRPPVTASRPPEASSPSDPRRLHQALGPVGPGRRSGRCAEAPECGAVPHRGWMNLIGDRCTE
ncbi:MAG: metalloregulator ArsR/SmtB family transcription factor [Chloroflexota bacterium]